MAIVFAAEQGKSGCLATQNGTGNLPSGVPDPIDRLTLKWSEADTGKSATASISAAEIASNGTWNVGVLPVSSQLQLQVYACTADGRVLWYGKGSDFVVKQGEDTTAQVFMTPPGKLACMGSNHSGGSLQTPRGFSGGVLLATGTAIVVGGADKWDGTPPLAKASNATDLYNYKLGTWRAGPQLKAPRIWPLVLPLDATHVLVAGGSALLTEIDAKQPKLPQFLFAPEDVSAADPPSEVLEILADSATSTPAVTDIGTGARPSGAATVAGDAIVFAGGLAADRTPSATGARVRGLAAIAANATVGTPEALSLAAARVQPNLLSYADGTVVVWGGQVSGKAADFGELISANATTGSPLNAVGSDIVDDPNAQVLGAAAVVLSEQGDLLTFFVTGGILVHSGWATGTPSYLVVVDRAAKSATCYKLPTALDTVLHDGTVQPHSTALPGGIGVAVARLDGGYLLVSGGLLSLGPISQGDPLQLCQDPTQTQNGCMVNDFVLLEPPVLTGAQASVRAFKVDALSPIGPHFGQIALPLPVGALLTGGMQSVSLPASATLPTFDGLGQLISAPFPPAASQSACQP